MLLTYFLSIFFSNLMACLFVVTEATASRDATIPQQVASGSKWSTNTALPYGLSQPKAQADSHATSTDNSAKRDSDKERNR